MPIVHQCRISLPVYLNHLCWSLAHRVTSDQPPSQLLHLRLPKLSNREMAARQRLPPTASASMEGGRVAVRSVEGLAFVCMAGSALSAGIVEGEASVSITGDAVDARSVEEMASACMGDKVTNAGSVEDLGFASTLGDAMGVRNAKELVSAIMDVYVMYARSAKE